MRIETLPTPLGTREGRVRARCIDGDRLTDYFEFVPTRVDRRAPLLVSVHGVSMNAREHAELFAEQAERLGVVVVAPFFAPECFPGYQRPAGRRGRSIRFLERVVADVRARHGLVRSRFSLFGFSGGAQFAHRYALLRPRRVRALIVAAAGWYTWPDRLLPYPLGLGPRPGRGRLRIRLRRFLRIPVRIAVGELDDARDPTLNPASEIDQLQGQNRIERARSWAEALRRAAAARGLVPAVSHSILPRTGHSFEEGVRLGGLADLVFEGLY
jgi:pimeloyl-ACP methyl ester carboxylesterase